jgi:hypothetical protein
MSEPSGQRGGALSSPIAVSGPDREAEAICVASVWPRCWCRKLPAAVYARSRNAEPMVRSRLPPAARLQKEAKRFDTGKLSSDSEEDQNILIRVKQVTLRRQRQRVYSPVVALVLPSGKAVASRPMQDGVPMRDLVADWKKWSRAERVLAVMGTLLIVALPLDC